MGTLGTGPFENDDALDFLDTLEDTDPDKRPTRVREALRRVVGATGYIEAPTMAEAVAAAAVVAGSADPDSVVGEPYLPLWLEEEPLDVDEGLAALAAKGLHRALKHDENEWWELWDEAEATDEVTDMVSKFLNVFGD